MFLERSACLIIRAGLLTRKEKESKDDDKCVTKLANSLINLKKTILSFGEITNFDVTNEMTSLSSSNKRNVNTARKRTMILADSSGDDSFGSVTNCRVVFDWAHRFSLIWLSLFFKRIFNRASNVDHYQSRFHKNIDPRDEIVFDLD